jgi:hypothetical protein
MWYQRIVRSLTLLTQSIVVLGIALWIRHFGRVRFIGRNTSELPWSWGIRLYGAPLAIYAWRWETYLSVLLFIILLFLMRRWIRRSGRIVPLWGSWVFLFSVVFFLGLTYLSWPSVRE